MRQLALPVPQTWGGRRRGAGRRPSRTRPGVPHAVRPWHETAHPSHVTLRLRAGLPSLRSGCLFTAVRDGIHLAQQPHFRICQFSVQRTHVHLLVEAKDRQSLSRGVQGMAIRLARRINRVLSRRGKVWGDRYHRRDLATPREVRHALVYVLMNHKKHGPDSRGIDLCSSGPWFTGWRDLGPVTPTGAVVPVAAPRTWLLAAGWRRLGLIHVAEIPRR